EPGKFRFPRAQDVGLHPDNLAHLSRFEERALGNLDGGGIVGHLVDPKTWKSIAHRARNGLRARRAGMRRGTSRRTRQSPRPARRRAATGHLTWWISRSGPHVVPLR